MSDLVLVLVGDPTHGVSVGAHLDRAGITRRVGRDLLTERSGFSFLLFSFDRAAFLFVLVFALFLVFLITGVSGKKRSISGECEGTTRLTRQI